jgi:hypothetical protein
MISAAGTRFFGGRIWVVLLDDADVRADDDVLEEVDVAGESRDDADARSDDDVLEEADVAEESRDFPRL